MEDFQILVGGKAGQGSKAAGSLIAKALNKCGYKIFIHEDYPSLIRGGHNFSLIRASEDGKRVIGEKVNYLLALDKNTVDQHIDELEGVLIYNSDQMEEEGIGVPIETIAKKEGGLIMQNTALFGAFCKLIGIDKGIMKEVAGQLPKPEKNIKVAIRAYESVESQEELKRGKNEPTALLTGNEAIALGALEAGMENYFAYPMTPSTSILHFLAKLKQKYDIQVMQPENEIAVINGALGAAFTGKRSMVGSSGGGFALMAEGLSLAGMSETPITVVVSQRMGPASGVPTYNAQADLKFALGAGHGDFLKLVFAPGDVEEAFYLTNLAMNMSWKYQVPAIVLVDKDISESTFSFDKSFLKAAEYWQEEIGECNEYYNRYQLNHRGISPLCYPGGEATVRVTSYEHNEYGTTTEDPEEIKRMQEKRLRKRGEIMEEINRLDMVEVSGEGNRAVITWGSSKMAVKSALSDKGWKIVQIKAFDPLPEERLKAAMEGVSEIVVVEANATGQAADIVEKTLNRPVKRVLKYDGRPFTEEEIIKNVN